MKGIGRTGGITDTPAEVTALAGAAALGEGVRAPDVPVTGERAVGSAGGTGETGVAVAEVRAEGEGTGGDHSISKGVLGVGSGGLGSFERLW